MTGSHGGLCLRLRDLARFGMLYTPSARRVTSDDLITAVDVSLFHGHHEFDDANLIE